MHPGLTSINHHASQTIVRSTIGTLQIMVPTNMYVVMDQLIVDTRARHKHQWT
jgi:predicted membrane protein